jgi:hypothetical protein
LLHDCISMAGEVEFWQIIYHEDHKKECYPFAKIHFNDKLTEFFENSVIEKLVMQSGAEKIAVCSWKLKQKMRWNVCLPRPLSLDVLKTDFQVMSFTCNTRYHKFLAAANAWHPGFSEIMKKILAHLGDPMPGEINNPIYQNAFCAKSSLYRDYVSNYLSPAMALMSSDVSLKELCWKDSNYSNLNKTDSAQQDYLERMIGVPYYPMHPFILERLFAIFCHNRKIKVDYL